MEQIKAKSVWNLLTDTPQEAANLRLRAELMQEISQTIKDNHWTQARAAKECGLTQPRMNDLLTGKIDKFSIDALVNISEQLDKHIVLSFQTVC
ncbi:MAG: XRE family transcriptional regulator [Cardiobacteriaceae bacterium]|nr:XRE family transcriptional regulator [Cardiobacteriaceae bacterium]